MWQFGELSSIELKENFFALYFAGKGIDANPDNLPYKIKFDKGIPTGAALWCVDNCQKKWGWLHVTLEPHKTVPHCGESYLFFESEEDAILFKLQHNF